MHETSSLHKKLFEGIHRVEIRVAIGESSILVNERGNAILFGGNRILVSRSGPESAYGENVLMRVNTVRQVFSNDKPEVGCCVAGEITVEMLSPPGEFGEFPRMARIAPYVRLTNGTEHGEWIQKGEYFIDTRSTNKDESGLEILTLHGYDAMLKSEQDYTGSALAWPAKDIAVVENIAELMGVRLDKDTVAVLTKGYEIQLPTGYTCREVLGYIAAMYAGNFAMSDRGELKLIQLNGIPKETRYLIDERGNALIFGEDRIVL